MSHDHDRTVTLWNNRHLGRILEMETAMQEGVAYQPRKRTKRNSHEGSKSGSSSSSPQASKEDRKRLKGKERHRDRVLGERTNSPVGPLPFNLGRNAGLMETPPVKGRVSDGSPTDEEWLMGRRRQGRIGKV